MSLIVTAQPAAEPLTLAEAKAQLQIRDSNTRFDTLISAQIVAARVYCELYLSKTIIATSYNFLFEKFPTFSFSVPQSPLISVSQITYTDTDSSPITQVLATSVYSIDVGVCPGIVYLNHGETWPSNRNYYNDITVSFTAGYADSNATSPIDLADQVPETIKHAMKLIVGDLFLNREQQMDIKTYTNPTADALLNVERLYLQ